ncbi:site-specific integrase [Janibacter terrae]|uniref:Site-specific integrase n=1 Tax=Janibacter terrae TaxID=103817 RepID=A0ABZ2FFT6_9MICO
MVDVMGKRSFGQITKLKSGRHRARYTDPEGRMTVSRTGKPSPLTHAAPHTFDTVLDAEAWLVDERRLISSGTWTPPVARLNAARAAAQAREDGTFSRYARGWLDGRHDLRASTRESYTTALNRHLLPYFGDMPIDEITVKDVRAWFNGYGTKTPTARAHAYQVLSAIMSTAEDEDEVITRNPCRIRAGGRTKVKREPEVLTLDELLALADAMPEHHRALTLVCGFGALRFGEAVALRRRDVDFTKGTVNVVRTAVRANREKKVNEPKTEAGKRSVALPPLVMEALRKHMQDLGIDGGRDALVFPGKDGNLLAHTALYGRSSRIERRGGKTYQKAGYGFHAAREAIGRPSLHWHDLRRTALTLGAQSGATVRELQSRAGHTTPTMALHYQQATELRDRAIADALQDRITAATSGRVANLQGWTGS